MQGNKLGTNYLFELCIQGNKTLYTSLTDDEDNEFPIVSVVFKGEYLTLNEK